VPWERIRRRASPKDAFNDNVEPVPGCLVGLRVEVCALSALCAVCVEVAPYVDAGRLGSRPHRFHTSIYMLARYDRKQMPSILIQLDEPLLRSLNKVAPAAKRQRAEFIRQAVKDAIRKREHEAIREAYLRQPDSAEDADDWSNADEWKP